jgi:thiosulfate oxidation carrier complex protein SoxZ
MSDPIRLSLNVNGELAELTIKLAHPMDAGGAPDRKTGKPSNANFLKTLAVQLNEKTLLEGQISPALGKSPVMRFSFKAVKQGDKFLVVCTDNTDQRFEKELVVPALAQKAN